MCAAVARAKVEFNPARLPVRRGCPEAQFFRTTATGVSTPSSASSVRLLVRVAAAVRRTRVESSGASAFPHALAACFCRVGRGLGARGGAASDTRLHCVLRKATLLLPFGSVNKVYSYCTSTFSQHPVHLGATPC